jgi:putative endonuclease
MSYWVYIVECADGTFYTGIATDVQRRLTEHNGANGKGARYTSARRPVTLIYETACETRSEALKAEIRIKRLTRREKEMLIARQRTVKAVDA